MKPGTVQTVAVYLAGIPDRPKHKTHKRSNHVARCYPAGEVSIVRFANRPGWWYCQVSNGRTRIISGPESRLTTALENARTLDRAPPADGTPTNE